MLGFQVPDGCVGCGAPGDAVSFPDGAAHALVGSRREGTHLVWLCAVPPARGALCDGCVDAHVECGRMEAYRTDSSGPIGGVGRRATEAAFLVGARRGTKLIEAGRLLASGNAEAALDAVPEPLRRLATMCATAETLAAGPIQEALAAPRAPTGADPERAGIAASISSMAVTGRPLSGASAAAAAARFADAALAA